MHLRIVFLGTPDFAVASLKNLLDNKKNIVAVVTAPDRPKGRGKKLGSSAVKEYAIHNNIPVLQPTNLKSEAFLEQLRSYEADLQIVVAFRMLPTVVWDMPRLGTFNLHASLLPQYRGAAPINWVIINGEKETGITTFFLKHEIDTGVIIYQEKESIHYDDTAESLHDRLMTKGGQLVLKTVNAIESGNYPQKPQPELKELKAAPKIFKEDCKVNWNDTSLNIRNFIRGLSPHPSAWSTFNGKTIKVFQVEVSDQIMETSVGEIKIYKNQLLVKVQNEVLSIKDMQLEGKKRMKTKDFLRGYNY